MASCAARRELYNAYLFDLDGTLVDTAPDLMRALNHVLDGAGFEIVDEALTRHWVGHGVRAMLTAAFEHHGAKVGRHRLNVLFDACLAYYGEHIADHSQPYPTVVETLTRLAERVPLAVVTNKPAGLTDRLLAALDLTRFFGSVVGRDTTAKHKPDAQPALHACRELGVAPGAALFVGDSATDVACARAAGCPVAIVRYGYSHGRDPATLGADQVIETLADLG